LLKRKAQEEIHPHSEQEKQDLLADTSAREFSIDKILLAAILPKRADVASVAAAAVEATEPMVVDLAKTAVSEPKAEYGIKGAVSEPQADGGIEDGIKEAVSEPQAHDGIQDDIKEAVSEPQAEGGIQYAAVSEPQAEEEAEYTDGYEDQTDYDYEDEAEDEDDYDYDESDYEEEEYDYEPQFIEHRPKVRALLLKFPEAANLEPHELDAAVERVLEQSKPKYADVAAPGKIRLLSEDIEIALDTWRPPPPEIILNLSFKDTIPPYEEAEEDVCEPFRAKVRRELIEKGYVEVDEDYYEKRDELDERMTKKLREEWDRTMDFSRFLVANSEDGICYYSEERGGYI
jgi:hypothetical protein